MHNGHLSYPFTSLRRIHRARLAVVVSTLCATMVGGLLFMRSMRTSSPLLVAITTTPDITGVVPTRHPISLLPRESFEQPHTNHATAPLASSTHAGKMNTAHEIDSPEIAEAPVMFNGRPIRPARTLRMVVTAYSPDEQSCGDSADGITASGYSVWTNGGKLAAADTDILPFGSLVSVPGYDNASVIPILDRGGAIKGHCLDVLFPTHEQAMEWGVQELVVIVWEYADGLPNGFVENHHGNPATE